MATYSSSTSPVRLEVSKALAGSGATEVINLFSIVGAVNIKKIYGIVTEATTLTNMTDCHWNVNDGAGDYPITKTTTCTMSSAIVGSVLTKLDAVTAVAYLKDGVAGGVVEGTSAVIPYEFMVIQKSATATYIQFIYTTTDAPIDATMKFIVEYEGINGGYLASV